MDIEEEIRFFDESQSEYGDDDLLTEVTYERRLRVLRPMYNLYELVLLLKPPGRRPGTFLVSSATKERVL